MANRYYVDNFKELTEKERNKLRQRFVCAECGEWVNWWKDPKNDKVYLACYRHDRNQHDGVAKEFIPPDDRKTLARRESMGTEIISVNQALAARNLPTTGTMNESQALQVCRVYWPKAPDTNIEAAAYLCRDYGLHPGANHIYLIPYAVKDQSGKVTGHRWEMIWSIAAKRLVTMRVKGQYSYIDDTPRKMSEAEEIKILGAVDKSKVRAITRLRNMQGMEASGIGEIGAGATVKGIDKGNSLLNMAMVRSESRALDRLPGDMSLPVMEAIDATFAETPDGHQVDKETGEIVEGEAKLVAEVEEAPSPTEKPKAKAKPKQEPTAEATEQVLHPEEQTEVEEAPPPEEMPLEEAPKSPIEMDWFQEQTGILQGKKLEGWTNAGIVGKLQGITGKNAKTVTEAVSYLNAEQAEEFVQLITDTVEMA